MLGRASCSRMGSARGPGKNPASVISLFLERKGFEPLVAGSALKEAVTVCEGQRHPGEALSLANRQTQLFLIGIGHLLSVEL